jgi:hypothetical protein
MGAMSNDPIAHAQQSRGHHERLRTIDLAARVYAEFLSAVCLRMGLELDAVKRELVRKGENTLEPHWRAASLARRRAEYLTNTEANIPQVTIARAVGLTPAAVCIACRKVEQSRDDSTVDDLLNDVAQTVKARRERVISLHDLLQLAGNPTLG